MKTKCSKQWLDALAETYTKIQFQAILMKEVAYCINCIYYNQSVLYTIDKETRC